MAALWAQISDLDTDADRRGTVRRTLRLVAQAARAQATNEVLILDLSTTGLMLETGAELAVDDVIAVELPPAGPIPARVIWKRDAYYGCEFLSAAPIAAVSAALLRSSPKGHGPAASAPIPISESSSGYWDYLLRPRSEPASHGVTTASLLLLLMVLLMFMLAFLTLPFSANQFV